MIRGTHKTLCAMRRYYENRELQRKTSYTWNKEADLDNIWNNCPKRKSKNYHGPVAKHFQASAGTFFIWWSDGVQTIHNHKQYWRGVIFTKTKNGIVTKYAGTDGKKCKPEIISK